VRTPVRGCALVAASWVSVPQNVRLPKPLVQHVFGLETTGPLADLFVADKAQMDKELPAACKPPGDQRQEYLRCELLLTRRATGYVIICREYSSVGDTSWFHKHNTHVESRR
jgi:hypothetical protein